MRYFLLILSLLSFSIYAQETTISEPNTIDTPVQKTTLQKSTKKSHHNLVKKKKFVNKKTKARNACLKGNPSLRSHKKRLNRCIKRKMNGFM